MRSKYQLWLQTHKRREPDSQVGMFDKDKEIGLNLTEEFERGEEFVLWDATVDKTKVDTSIGKADKTRLTVSRVNNPSERYEVTSLGSAIAEKAKEAGPDDFPAVVKWITVESQFGNDATVLRFVKEFTGSERGAQKEESTF